MKHIIAAIILAILYATPASAVPLYAGMLASNDTAGVLLGYRIDSKYAVEANFSQSSNTVSHAGVTVDTKVTDSSLVGLALFPKMLKDVLPYMLFVKAGYLHTSTKETFHIPASVTLTFPYTGNQENNQNRLILGGGAEYNFSKQLWGRTTIDFYGNNRSISLAVLYKF